jgi:hypothetical protein
MTEIDLAEEIIDGRKCLNTKVQYLRKYAHFQKWVQQRYPECYDDTTASVILPAIQKSHLLDFFGFICKKKDKFGAFIEPTTYQTFQHVSGYKSAIKDNFSRGNVNLAAM